MNGLTPRGAQTPRQAAAAFRTPPQTPPRPQRGQSPPPAPEIDKNRICATRLNDQLKNLEEFAATLTIAIIHLVRQETATNATLASGNDALELPFPQGINDHIASLTLNKQDVVNRLAKLRDFLEYLNNDCYRRLLSDYQNLRQAINTLRHDDNIAVLVQLDSYFQQRLDMINVLLNGD